MINAIINFTLPTRDTTRNTAKFIAKNISSSFFEKNKEINAKQTDIKLIAHRGYSSIAPENTIPAFIAAAENGYNTIECDIDWTKDEVAVLMHDKDIDRTSNIKWWERWLGGDKCKHYTFDELRKYDFGSWKGEEFKETKIPSFSEALKCAKENNLNLYIELKKEKGFTEERAEALIEQIKEVNMEDKITWISFDADCLKTISKMVPNSRLGFLVKSEPNKNTIKTLEWLQNEDNEVFLDVKAQKMTKEADELLENAGFEFEAWTVDDIETLKLMEFYGCQGITTNAITQSIIDGY